MLFLRVFALSAFVCIYPCAGDDLSSVARYEALGRIVQAAHTTDLPTIDRVEVLALRSSDNDGEADPQSDRFLVRPAAPAVNEEPATLPSPEISVTSHSLRVLTAKDAKRVADNWRSLEFQPNGAFCHIPAYGLRFFRDGELIFSVSVCWKCHNFYLPTIDPQTGRPSVILYGFDDNAAAKKLLNDLRRLVPHPEIRHPRLR